MERQPNPPIYDHRSGRLCLSELSEILDACALDTAADFASQGPSRVRRVWLGRLEDLSPSRRYWGPLVLDSWLDDEWPFDFDDAGACDRCCEDATRRWTDGGGRVLPCSPRKPCVSGGRVGSHCQICRDATWFGSLFEQAMSIDAVLQQGDIRRSDLYVVRFVARFPPS